MLSFSVFIEEISNLQNGPFDKRLELWLLLVQEMEEDVKAKYKTGKDINVKPDLISKEKLISVGTASYP
jgi:hypothetical protein